MKSKLTLQEYIGRQAALLSLVEVGLGSFVHALKIPLGGHALSLNQSFFIGRAALKARSLGHSHPRQVPFTLSLISAILKSLSPAGHRIGPMLSISMQGFLFTIGIAIAGLNVVGLILGSVLSSIWAFAHPVLTYLILYGQTILDVAEYYYNRLNSIFHFQNDELLLILGAVIGIKAVFAIGVGYLAYSLSDDRVERYQERMIHIARRSNRSIGYSNKTETLSPAVGAIRDLTRPIFLASLVLTGLFFYFSEAPFSTTLGALMRPVAIGFILFYFIRLAPWTRWKGKWERFLPKTFVVALKTAIRQLRER